MEPEVVAFLKRVAKSLMIGLCWLIITVTAAIKGDNAFIEGPVRLGNILFYIWFLGSVFLLVKIFRTLWTFKDDEGQG